MIFIFQKTTFFFIEEIMKRIWLLALTIALAPSAKAETSGLDINDVAVLFPISAEKQLFPKITLDNKEPLVSKEVFDEALEAAKKLGIVTPTGTPSITQLNDYVITGFRYDPCAPKDHMGPEVSDCVPEIRLIAQPMDSFGPADTALHLVYGLTDSEPKPGDETIADLFKAKAKAQELLGMSSSGLPLNVHPLLAAAAKSGNQEVAAIYEAIVRKYAKPEKLKKLTMMGLGSQTHWIFFGGSIVAGKWVQDTIPGLSDNGRLAVELNLNSTDLFIPAPLDINTSTYGFFRRELLLDGQIDTIRNEVLKMENPSFTNRNNSDCLSCHSASSLHTNSAARVPVFVEGASATAPKGITAYPAQGLLQRHRLHWNLRSFGYFGVLPTLSMHTVNEAGRSAAKVNEILSRINPGRDCSAVQQEVVSCYFKAIQSIGRDGPIDNSAKCMDSCQAAEPALPLLSDSTAPGSKGAPETRELQVTETEVREPLHTDPKKGSIVLLKLRACRAFLKSI